MDPSASAVAQYAIAGVLVHLLNRLMRVLEEFNKAMRVVLKYLM